MGSSYPRLCLTEGRVQMGKNRWEMGMRQREKSKTLPSHSDLGSWGIMMPYFILGERMGFRCLWDIQ